jgi:hypothetical protein
MDGRPAGRALNRSVVIIFSAKWLWFWHDPGLNFALVHFKNGRRTLVAVPQGLKPLPLAALFGTTEVVP